MNCGTTVVVLMVAATLIFVCNVNSAEAKRGCASFGHSCYGGMGKRASDVLDTNEEILQNVQDEENPAFVFTGPRSSYQPKMYAKMTPQQYDNISKVIRQWIQSYRKNQELQDNNI